MGTSLSFSPSLPLQDAAEPKCLDRQSEASKSEIRDVECQMEISVESVQLSSVVILLFFLKEHCEFTE